MGSRVFAEATPAQVKDVEAALLELLGKPGQGEEEPNEERVNEYFKALSRVPFAPAGFTRDFTAADARCLAKRVCEEACQLDSTSELPKTFTKTTVAEFFATFSNVFRKEAVAVAVPNLHGKRKANQARSFLTKTADGAAGPPAVESESTRPKKKPKPPEKSHSGAAKAPGETEPQKSPQKPPQKPPEIRTSKEGKARQENGAQEPTKTPSKGPESLGDPFAGLNFSFAVPAYPNLDAFLKTAMK